MERLSFTFYRSFYEAIEDLPKSKQLEVYRAIMRFGFDGEDTELTGVSAAVFKIIRPILEKNLKKFKNGCKGGEYGILGAEYGIRGGRPPKETPQITGQETPQITGQETPVNINNKIEKEKEKKIQKEKTSFSFDARIFENLKERVNKLFNRRSSTAWSDKETKQLKAVAKREGVLDELAEIEALYNSGYEYRRKDVITFLNNFATELDRARNSNQGTCPNQGETSSEAEPMYKAGRDYVEPAPKAGGETPIKRADMRAINFREGEND